MMLVEIKQGDRVLGTAWFCVNDEPGPDYCDECEDYQEEQMEMFQ